jgi:hypothetical protein
MVGRGELVRGLKFLMLDYEYLDSIFMPAVSIESVVKAIFCILLFVID